MNIYDKIKLLADSQKITIQELEKRAGLGNGTIGKWKETSPSFASIAKVAGVLNVSLDIFTDKEV